MKVLNRRCAGLDVHKDEVVACVRLAMRNKLSHEVGVLQRRPAGFWNWRIGWRRRV
jgi:hypothetical protein